MFIKLRHHLFFSLLLLASASNASLTARQQLISEIVSSLRLNTEMTKEHSALTQELKARAEGLELETIRPEPRYLNITGCSEVLWRLPNALERVCTSEDLDFVAERLSLQYDNMNFDIHLGNAILDIAERAGLPWHFAVGFERYTIKGWFFDPNAPEHSAVEVTLESFPPSVIQLGQKMRDNIGKVIAALESLPLLQNPFVASSSCTKLFDCAEHN